MALGVRDPGKHIPEHQTSDVATSLSKHVWTVPPSTSSPQNTFENLFENLAGILGQFHCLYHHRQMNLKIYLKIEFGCCDTVNIIIAISLVLCVCGALIWAKVVLIIRSNPSRCIH